MSGPFTVTVLRTLACLARSEPCAVGYLVAFDGYNLPVGFSKRKNFFQLSYKYLILLKTINLI